MSINASNLNETLEQRGVCIMVDQKNKKCPYCGEEILEVARNVSFVENFLTMNSSKKEKKNLRKLKVKDVFFKL